MDKTFSGKAINIDAKISYDLKGLLLGDFIASSLFAIGLTLYGAAILIIASGIMVDFDLGMLVILLKQIALQILPKFYPLAVIATMVFCLARHYSIMINPSKMIDLYIKEYKECDLHHFRLGKNLWAPKNPHRFGKNRAKFFNI
jgi:hypothetical protein